jgi:hypothetical protein
MWYTETGCFQANNLGKITGIKDARILHAKIIEENAITKQSSRLVGAGFLKKAQ